MAGIFGSVLIDIQARVANLEAGQKKTNAALKKIQDSAKQTANSLKSIDAQAAKTGASINKAFRISKVVFLAMSALRIFRNAWNTMLEGAKAEQAMIAFGTIVKKVGGDTRDEFRKIQRASKGILSEADILQATNTATSLGIPIEKVSHLMEIAQAKSRDMGTTMADAFTDIAKGIGRGSRLVLDNLGILLRIDEASRNYARTMNKTVAELTDWDKRQAILNDVIDKGSEALKRYNLNLLTTYEKMQLASARADDAWKSFSKLASEVIIASKGMAALTDLFKYFSAEEGLKRELESVEKQLKYFKNERLKHEIGGPGLKLTDYLFGMESKDVIDRRISILTKRANELKRQFFSHTPDVKTPPPPQESKDLIKFEKSLILDQAKLNFQLSQDKLAQSMAQTREDDLKILQLARFQESERLVVFEKQKNKLEEIRGKYGEGTEELHRINQLHEQIGSQIENQKIKIEENRRALLVYEGTAMEGLKQGFIDVEKSINTTFQNGEKIAKDSADAMSKAFEDGFFNIMQGKFKDLEDVGRSFLESMQRMIASIIADMLKAKLIAGVKSIFTSAVGAGAEGSSSFANDPSTYNIDYGSYHSGGMVKRYHRGGGLAADEVPAILQTGEVVLSRDQVKGAQSGGSGGGGGNTFIIQAMDSRSFVEFLTRNGGAVGKVLSDDLRRSGSMRSAIRKNL